MAVSPPSPVDRLRLAVTRTAELVRGRVATGLTHDDADDHQGTVATDSAIGFDPLPLLAELDRQGARVVVIGQVAGILHGSQELTGDLDLLWDGAPERAAAMAAAFGAFGARLTDDDGAELPCAPAAFRLPKLDFATPSASGDCCTPALPWGSLDVAGFAERALTVPGLDGTALRYLTRADLIAMRRAVGRPKDLRRAEELERLI
ncbi:hypothetical protein OG455_08040 [Kitasatospora sp. NBC_01287]|uniref:hypothetical protein n=1 Tax=Kitasatospora sp. NBC_01287 TaxID=2903573 RepID=UPI002252AD28|nr:hypothetical protein [Kitasatospora sp. NBC_01287]MCX4745472.1 hypothetical protein [Kitasatospora sp. NBC_01287]